MNEKLQIHSIYLYPTNEKKLKKISSRWGGKRKFKISYSLRHLIDMIYEIDNLEPEEIKMLQDLMENFKDKQSPIGSVIRFIHQIRK